MLAVSLIAAVIAAANILSANAQIVVAHLMAQKAFLYSQNDWINNINAAKATGIDAFVGREKANFKGIKITFTPVFISFRDPSETGTLLSTFLSIDVSQNIFRAWNRKFYPNSDDGLAGGVGSDDEGAEGRRAALEEMNAEEPENGSAPEEEDES
ncbi:hypothetical protein DFH09DRAFT_1330625 [Mycena vulgaris]|nr:hypothetical protein DFH09DRAFT_1330625 [Mycena vulgaris]